MQRQGFTLELPSPPGSNVLDTQDSEYLSIYRSLDYSLADHKPWLWIIS